jgi:hypothetical protein
MKQAHTRNSPTESIGWRFPDFPAAIRFKDDCPLATGLAICLLKKKAGDAIDRPKRKRQV